MTERNELNRQARSGKLAICGLGMIGAPLAVAAAQHASALILIDRDRVELKNVQNQALYEPEDVGRFKVDAACDRLRRRFSGLEIKAIAADIEDVPIGWFEVPDALLGAVDSLRARQLLNERSYRFGIPLIDGGVGEPMLGRVHVFMPGDACAECHWTPAHYRRLSLETPCIPGGNSRIPPTRSPSATGSAVASMMDAEALKLMSGQRDATSVEIAFDLVERKFAVSRMHRAKRCRFDHEIVMQKRPLPVAFASATVGDVLDAVRSEPDGMCVEVRRGIFRTELFGHDCRIGRDRLKSHANRSLSSLGLTPMDRLRVIPGNGQISWFLTLAQ